MSQTQAATPTKFPALTDPTGNNRLLDAVSQLLRLKNDAALARVLEVAPPVISKVRHARLPIGPTLLLRLHLVSRMPVLDMTDLARGVA